MRLPDRRYTVTREFTGAPNGPHYVARFAGNFLASKSDRRNAELVCWLRQFGFDFRITSSGSQLDDCITWLFSVADYLHAYGDTVPVEWGYRPGAGGPNTDAPEYRMIADYRPPLLAVQTFGKALRALLNKLDATE